MAGEPVALSASFGPEVAAAGADGAEAGRADDGADGAEAGVAATLTGLGAVAAWVAEEPTEWTVEPTAWAALDGAAADDSGEEPVVLEPDVAAAARVECPVDAESADGVGEAAETTGAAADVTGLAGTLWDWLAAAD